MLRGKDQLAAGKPASALDLFRDARKAGAEFPELHFYEAKCHMAMGTKPAALAAFKAFLDKTPDKESAIAREAALAIEQLAAPAEQP